MRPRFSHGDLASNAGPLQTPQYYLSRLEAGGFHEPEVPIRSGSRSVARLVRPGLEVHGLGRSNADQNSQDLNAGSPLGHRRIETVASLLDCRKVKACRVCNRLQEVRVLGVVIGSRDRGMLPNCQAWDHLREGEGRIKIRIIGTAPVTSPPTRIYGELREICQPQFATRSSGRTARQSGIVRDQL